MNMLLMHVFDRSTLHYGSETGNWYGKCKYCGHDLISGSFPGYDYGDAVIGVFKDEYILGTTCQPTSIMKVLSFNPNGDGGRTGPIFHVEYSLCREMMGKLDKRKNNTRIIRIRNPCFVSKVEKRRIEGKESIQNVSRL